MPAVKKNGYACGGFLLHIALMMPRILKPAAISVYTPAKARKEGSQNMKLKPLLTYDLQDLSALLSPLSLASH